MVVGQSPVEVTVEASPTAKPQVRDGWIWLVLETASRVYLVGMMTLTVCALFPGVLGWQGHVIHSGSMEPHVHTGDVVLSTTIPAGEVISAGQVVFFTVPGDASASYRGSTRMHRVVGVNADDTFITQGDANETPDSTPVTREQVTGRARLLVPWIGLPTHWIGTRSAGLFALWTALTLGALLVVAFSTTRTQEVKTARPPAAKPAVDQPTGSQPSA